MKPVDTATLVAHAFGGMKDKGGVPLSHHAARVASHVDTELEKTVALLHDVVEDTNVTLEYLEECGYSPEVIEAVDLLTHRKKEMDYASYIDRICASGNVTAIKVKLADQKDNLDPKRWLHLNRYQQNALSKRYAGVKEKLHEALDACQAAG